MADTISNSRCSSAGSLAGDGMLRIMLFGPLRTPAGWLN